MKFICLSAIFLCVGAQKISFAENIVTCNVNLTAQDKKSFGYTEDAYLNVSEIIMKYSYPVEEHEVITSDGYILTIIRIPRGKKKSKRKPGPPVLLEHGMTDSQATWVLSGTEYGLGYQLADAGYDVWLGSYRGCRYTRRHVSLDPDRDVKFWKFSSEEMAAYDIPATVERILQETGSQSVAYVGHSLGCRVFFEMTGYVPEIYDKINSMSCLGPAVYVGNLFNPVLRMLAQSIKRLEVLGNTLGVQEIFGSNSMFTQLIQLLCAGDQIFNSYLQERFCVNLLFLIVGDNYDQLRRDMMPVLMGHVPNGTSLKMLVLFAQGILSKKFQRFDHGFEGNMRLYGASTPPEYDVSKVTSPVSILIGRNDWLSSLKDAETLKSRLPNVFEYHVIPHRSWQHADYVWARDAPRVVGDRILRMLQKYTINT